MKLIPSIINQQVSAAERKVFNLLQSCTGEANGFVFHSLGLAHHPTKPVSELDFVVLTRRGILVIEVKGGGISQRAGEFFSRNRYGTQNSIQNPFRQAQAGSFALRRTFDERFPDYRLLTGFAVAFPDTRFEVQSVEWDNNIVIDSRDCDSASAFAAALERIYNYWEDKLGVRHLTGRQVDRLGRAMRPEFERAISISGLV